MKSSLVLITTVPDTFAHILKYQPSYLGRHYDVSLCCSSGRLCETVKANENLDLVEIDMARGINPFADLVSIVRMVIFLLKKKPSVVHSYTPKAGLVAMLAAWLCGVPTRIHTFTGLIFPTEKGLKRKVLILIDRLICMAATVVVPEGEGVKKDLIQHKITNKPMAVIGYGNVAGCDTEYFSQNEEVAGKGAHLRQQLGIPEEAFVYCFIGRLTIDKGIRELHEAFSRLPEGSWLLLVGGEDQRQPLPLELREKLEASKNIALAGFQEDIRPATLISDVVVLPSYREGFPNVLLQAGAMAKPCIATNINGCNEIVIDGSTGWLAPARDSESLERAMAAARMVEASEMDAMGLRARQLIIEKFEKKGHWARMLKFYKQYEV